MHEIPNVIDVHLDSEAMINPTYGWFAVSTPHAFGFSSIVLRDFGIGNNLESYVGYVATEWLSRENITWREKCALPPELLFTREFLRYVPVSHLDREADSIDFSRGRLFWRKRYRLEDAKYRELIKCTLNGRDLVWELDYSHKSSHVEGCHIMGVWKD